MPSSRSKKTIKLFVGVAVTRLVIFLLSPRQGRYPWQTSPYMIPGSVWVSEEPMILLCIPEKSISIENAECSLESNGEWIAISLYMDETKSDVVIMRKGDTLFENALLTGKKVKCTSEKVVIRVKDDNIFDGKYDKITLVRIIPASSYGIGDISTEP